MLQHFQKFLRPEKKSCERSLKLNLSYFLKTGLFEPSIIFTEFHLSRQISRVSLKINFFCCNGTCTPKHTLKMYFLNSQIALPESFFHRLVFPIFSRMKKRLKMRLKNLKLKYRDWILVDFGAVNISKRKKESHQAKKKRDNLKINFWTSLKIDSRLKIID